MYRSLAPLLFFLGASYLAVAFEFSSFDTGTLSSLSNTSAPTPSSKTGLTSQPFSISTPSTIPGEQLPPDSNSRGDYVTTRYTTQHPTYTLPLGFTETEPFGPSGVLLVGPTTWATQDVLPVVEVANDLNTTSSAPQSWDPKPFLSLEDQTILTGDPSFISYGRDPKCTSAFNSYVATNPSTTYTGKSAGTITLSNGQTSMAVVYTTGTLPMASQPHCCGTCSLYFKDLQMLYWPARHPNTACLEKPSATLNSTSTSGVVAARDQSVYVTDSDGYVYTSPSIYVRFPTVSASDACGFVGSASTSITLAFSPGELSTFVWENYQRTSSLTYTSALDTADLPCGPWNGTDKFLPEPWSNYSSYQPLIALPSKLINLVPAWKSCTADIFEGQDPPRVLTPAAAMAPTPTDAGRDAQNNAASPIPTIPSLPRKTEMASPQPADPSPKTKFPPNTGDPPTGASGDPKKSIAPSNPDDPLTKDPGDFSDDDSSSKPNDPSSAGTEGSSEQIPHPNVNGPSTDDPGDSSGDDPPSKPGDASSTGSSSSSSHDTYPKPNDPSTEDPGDSSEGDPPSKPEEPSSAGSGGSSSDKSQSFPNDPSTGSYKDPSDSKEPADKAASPAHSPASKPTGIPDGDPPVQSPSNLSPAGSKADSKNDLPVIFLQSNTITQGASPLTISKQPVVYQSGTISAGRELKAIPTGWGQSNGDANPIVVGGLTFSAVQSAAKANNGDSYSGNDHAANSAQIDDPAGKHPDSATYITVAGQTIAVDANAISVAGTTLRPGDPGVTVDGTPISLGSSIFVVGTKTETLSLPQTAMTSQLAHITVGSRIIDLGSSAIFVDGTTLKPADPAITVDGARVSLGPSFLVVGSYTKSLVLSHTTPAAAPSYITVVAGETIAVNNDNIVVANHTLTPGAPPVTANGTLVSLGPSILVVGTQTVSFSLPTASSGDGIGGLIMKGLGGIGGGSVAAPTMTGGWYNGTRRVGNATVVFRGGGEKEVVWWFWGWVIWEWVMVLVFG